MNLLEKGCSVFQLTVKRVNTWRPRRGSCDLVFGATFRLLCPRTMDGRSSIIQSLCNRSSIIWNSGDTWSTFTSLSHMGYSLEGVSFIWPIGLSWIIQEYTFHKVCIVADWNRDFGNGDFQVCRVCWVSSSISRWRVKGRSVFTHRNETTPESWWNWSLNGIMDLKRLVSRFERTGEKDWAKNTGKSCCFDKRSCDGLRWERRPQWHQ